ncbi:MAG: phage holin family protein [Acidimicrobiia bacterium]
MKRIAIRIAINAVALWAAAVIVGGITLEGGIFRVLLVAAVFGLVNAIVRPIVILFSLPAVVLTVGIALIAINALMLVITAALTTALDVEGFGSALLGTLVISPVSWIVGRVLPNEKGRRTHHRTPRRQT